MLHMDKIKQGMVLRSVLLVVLIAALYGQFLWNPIVFDDLPFFMLDEQGHSNVLQYAVSFSLLQLRSLPYATLAWTAQVFGYDLIGFRIGNLLLHAATVLALFFFLSQLFEVALSKHAAQRKDGLNLHWAAFFAALLFGLHPVATYGAGYLVQRTIVMATLFTLLAMFAYVRGCARQKSSWLWASVFFYYLAVLSKEHAIMLPAVILVLTVLLHTDWMARIKKQWPLFAAYAAVAVFVLLAKKGIFGSVYEIDAPTILQNINTEYTDIEYTYPLSILTQSWLFFKYWALWLFPNPAWMSVDMREPFASSFISLYTLALFAFLLYGFLAIRLLLKRGTLGLLGFALLFPWLMFMTEFASVRIQEEFVLYRSYLWAVGAFALLPLVFWKVTKGGAMLMLGIVALFMFAVSMERLSTFSHPLLLWDDAEKLVHGRSDLPGAYRIYYNRGTENIKIDRYDDAIRDLKRSIALYADLPAAYGNLGAAYLKKGEFENALQAFTQAVQRDEAKKSQPNVKHYQGRAMANEALKNWAAASEDYKISCKLGGRGCNKTNLPQISISPAAQ